MTERERKKIEVLKRKFLLEQERSTKPGECNKYVTAVINQDIIKQTVGSKILEKLREIDVKTEINNLAPHSVTWRRTVNKRIISENGEVVDFGNEEKNEPHLLMILIAETFVKAAKDNQLLNMVQSSQQFLPVVPQSTTLVIFGLKDFCRKRKGAIGMKETEIKLTQLQILANCSHRLHETPDDIALTVMQMSKAIAEEPYKSKQNKKLDQEQMYLTGGTKVALTDDPASYARLWQAQLITLPKVTFEVAQSIAKEYPLPRTLVEAYKTTDNPTKMLADIPIIRTAPLAKLRRIGPELSRKMHVLMTSTNPNDIL